MKPWVPIVRVAAGCAFIILGILGCFLPILQGILFLAVGVALLAPYVPWFKKIRNTLYRRFPKAKRFVEDLKARLRKGSKDDEV